MRGRMSAFPLSLGSFAHFVFCSPKVRETPPSEPLFPIWRTSPPKIILFFTLFSLWPCATTKVRVACPAFVPGQLRSRAAELFQKWAWRAVATSVRVFLRLVQGCQNAECRSHLLSARDIHVYSDLLLSLSGFITFVLVCFIMSEAWTLLFKSKEILFFPPQWLSHLAMSLSGSK